MAAGKIETYRYTKADSPYTLNFTRSFAADSRVLTTATQAGYSGPPDGYYGVFAGFSTNSSQLLLNIFDPNATEGGTLLSTRNKSTSALNNRPCNFHASYIRNDMIQDERNL